MLFALGASAIAISLNLPCVKYPDLTFQSLYAELLHQRRRNSHEPFFHLLRPPFSNFVQNKNCIYTSTKRYLLRYKTIVSSCSRMPYLPALWVHIVFSSLKSLRPVRLFPFLILVEPKSSSSTSSVAATSASTSRPPKNQHILIGYVYVAMDKRITFDQGYIPYKAHLQKV